MAACIHTKTYVYAKRDMSITSVLTPLRQPELLLELLWGPGGKVLQAGSDGGGEGNVGRVVDVAPGVGG